uniref:SAM domain-containing protein n=1 Tax=Globodera rostochiensis TaxID=31243 RepID=A0A914HYM6_GLORO
MRSSSPATDGSMINGSSCDSLQRQIGGGFWKNWHTVEDENLEKIATKEDGGREENSSSSSAETSDGVICADPSGGSPPPDFVQFVPSPSSSSRPSSSPKSINTSSESDDQVPSSNLDSSASSERSTVALSRNELKNMRFFIKAINQSKLATPIALEDKLKVLSCNSNEIAAQLIRKWSTKSNSNGTELIRTLREQFGGRSAGSIASRWNCGRSASSSSSRPHLAFLVQQSDSAIGSSFSGSCSFLPPPPPYRPLRCSSGSEGAIPTIDSSVSVYRHQQTVGAIINTNGGNFGGEGKLQPMVVGRAKDFTSLLGFDCIVPQMRDCEKEKDARGRPETEKEGPKGQSDQGGGGGRSRDYQSLRTASSATMENVLSESGGGAQQRKEAATMTAGCGAQPASPSPSPSMSASCSDFPESQERLHRLQITRDSLSFQVAVLSRQVALQREKIQDLEESLGGTSSPKQHVRGAGQSQQKEIEQQLDELRHKYLALEREKTEAERFLIMSNIEADRVCQHSPERKDTEIDELERLQMAVRSLMADNEQKNSLIQTLQNALEEQQRRMLGANLYQQQNGVPSHQLDINEQIRRILLLDDLSLDGSDQSMMAHSSSFPAGLCGQSLRSSSPRRSPQPAPASGPAPARQHFPTSTSFSSSLSHLKTMGMIPPPPLWRVSSPPPTIPPHRFVEEPPTHLPQLEQPSTSSSGRTPASPLARQLAAELDELRQSGMGALLRQPYSSASLPRSIHSKSNSFGACTTNRLRQAVESDDELASARGSVPNSQTLDGHLTAKRLKKGRRARSTLRSFLGRFTHRGNSLQDVRPSPRSAPLSLPPAFPPHGGPSPCFSVRPSISQFVDWDCAHCSRWLTEVGFGDALVGAVRSGRHLLSMPEADFETELGVRSALQRKRLKCMLDRIERNSETEAADKMDTNMVMLWLDQIGLPQLRDSFAENRVNGHLLLVLSMQDLMELGIQSALNHASLARAIQFLRSVDFHLHRLEKHFSSELLLHCPIPAQVERWSHCCVVEWLRSEDLDEFTPNLAFSGLHGALMVYEPTFTAESLAEMLQIPPTKTLIRRHLSTQFNSVLGQQIVGNKRETVSQPMAVHLTPGLRIRLAKGGFSLGRKKSKSDIFVEPEVRVCPEHLPEVTLNGGGREEMSEV